MELRQVEHFLAVARAGSFTAAAAHVHVVQSALSASIRKLETELGAPLFERTTRRVMLTEAGRALLPLAQRILADVEAARDEVAAVSELTRGRVAIGTIQTLTVIDLPGQLGRFRQHYPGIHLHVRDGTVPALAAAVTAGDLDLSFLAGVEPLAGGLISFSHWTQELVLVCPAGHRLGKRRRIRLPELEHEPFLVFRRSGIQALLERECAAAGVALNPVCEATHVPLLFELVAAGLGVTVLPRPVAERSGLPFTEFDHPGFQREIHLAGREQTPSNPAARALLAHLLD
ncbi:LysR family transcriptional regulator [Nocardia sp. NPDC051832]|uniref:LysR family transcriptional regulator n=1 Tax=Nocardia sp. NPDC051832 TaxID=3155673 RepID=UPI00342DA898